MSLTVARVAVLTALPIAPLGPIGPISVDAFGPVPDVIDRARSGDRAAFAELYDAHVDSVYRYLLYRVREPSDAEDLTSDVFTRAFANIHRYRWQGKSFLAWLYTIARNAVTDRRRRQRPTVDLENAFGLAEDGPTAHEHAVRGEEVDALRGAVKHLTTEQQEVLVLRFVENMSSRQVANMLAASHPNTRYSSSEGCSRFSSSRVSAVYDKPSRRVSTSDTANRGSPATASRLISSLCSAFATAPWRWGGRPVGTSTRRSRAAHSMAA